MSALRQERLTGALWHPGSSLRACDCLSLGHKIATSLSDASTSPLAIVLAVAIPLSPLNHRPSPSIHQVSTISTEPPAIMTLNRVVDRCQSNSMLCQSNQWLIGSAPSARYLRSQVALYTDQDSSESMAVHCFQQLFQGLPDPSKSEPGLRQDHKSHCWPSIVHIPDQQPSSSLLLLVVLGRRPSLLTSQWVTSTQ